MYVRVILRGILLTACLCLCACVSNRMSLHEGIQSFQVQDYRQAFIRLKPEADRGQPDAEYAVGYMYYYGQGVVEDRQQAWYWISRAAKAGQPDALVAIKIVTHPKKS